MDFFRSYKKGFIIGALFGTVGVFVLALLSLMFPVAEVLAYPFLWPGKFFSSLLVTGNTVSISMVTLLYLCTALLYAIIGMLLQMLLAPVFHKKKKK